MKIIANIARFILITILTICIIAMSAITIVSSTILNKNYIISKLEEANFYEEVYKLVETNFENYIYQSGLDEIVLKDICTEEKVKQDINVMLSNIYEGTNKKIDTTEIEDNLNRNIDNLKVRNKQNASAIDQFVKYISKEYIDTILHTNYEEKISNVYSKIIKILEKVNITILIIMVVDCLILLIISIKEISKFMQGIGISLLSSSTFGIVAYNIVTTKVYVQGIKIFNDIFSKTIVTIIQEILNKIQTLGTIGIIFGIMIIVIYAIIKAIKNNKVTKE